MSFSNNIQS
jgi:hypothetical protein